jgi:hypothetical protein
VPRRASPPPPTELERELALLSGLAADGRLPDYLEAWGERGERDVACACVLANHLWRRLGVDVEISYRRTGDSARLEVLDAAGAAIAPLPAPLARFVRAFDAGEYPELIEEDNCEAEQVSG